MEYVEEEEDDDVVVEEDESGLGEGGSLEGAAAAAAYRGAMRRRRRTRRQWQLAEYQVLGCWSFGEDDIVGLFSCKIYGERMSCRSGCR